MQFLFAIVICVWCLVLIVVIAINYLYSKFVLVAASIYWLLYASLILLTSATSYYNVSVVNLLHVLLVYVVVPIPLIWSACAALIVTAVQEVILVRHLTVVEEDPEYFYLVWKFNHFIFSIHMK